MNNNIINVGLKALVAIIAIIGIFLTVSLVKSGNPAAYDNKEIISLGTEQAKLQGMQDKLTQAELEQWIMDEGIKIKEQREKEVQAKVDVLINFTFYLLYFVVFILVAGTLFSIAIDFKRYVVGLIGAAVFLILAYVVYVTTSDVVPAEYVAMEAKEMANNPNYEPLYTPENWKMVSAAFSMTIILGGIAILAWIGGSVMKFIK